VPPPLACDSTAALQRRHERSSDGLRPAARAASFSGRCNDAIAISCHVNLSLYLATYIEKSGEWRISLCFLLQKDFVVFLGFEKGFVVLLGL